MQTKRRLLFVVALLCLASAPLQAQTKLFVASYGSDANNGLRATPMRNFQAAHDALQPGGQIVVLDTAGYGQLTITKSISITVPRGVTGFVTVTGTNAGITISAGPADIVNLRGLTVEGGGGAGSVGIFTNGVGMLRVEGCEIRNFDYGVYLYNADGAKLVADDCDVHDVKTGIEVRASSINTTADGVVTDSRVDAASGTGFNGAFYVETDAASAVATLTVKASAATHSVNGLKAYGVGATLYADNCLVSGNVTGVSAASNGTTISRGNNTFTNNATDGSFNGTQLAPK